MTPAQDAREAVNAFRGAAWGFTFLAAFWVLFAVVGAWFW